MFMKVGEIGRVQPNPNEVRDIRFVTKDQLEQLVEDSQKNRVKLTPWFALIKDSFLFPWWEKVLTDYDALPENEEKIHDLRN